MIISSTLIWILFALLLFGIGFYFWAPAGPRTKAWVIFGLFVIATLVILSFAGVIHFR